MTNLTINPAIYQQIPTLKIGFLTLSNIDNNKNVCDFFDKELEKITAHLTAKFDGVELAEYPLIKRWREIYRGFGEKKARSSIESLIKRVVSGKGLYRINPLVDIYNLASLKFELPCGGEDTDTMHEPLELTVADGTETFLPLGATETEHPNAGEIIYKSGNTVVCRNFNYRESDITKLTPDTVNAIIIFEDVTGCEETLNAALDWVSERATTLLGAKIKGRIIQK